MTLFEAGTGAPTAPAGPLVRVRMTVAYDGRDFHGFAANTGVKTVGATLASAIERVLGHPVAMACAGRTDTGVHARGQVVSFDARAAELDLDRLQRSVNGLCGPQIAVREAALAGADFDARHSAVARTYRYTVLQSAVPDPLLAATAWHVATALDVASMRLGCDPLIGEHDFSSFCRRPKTSTGVVAPSMTRRVIDARWKEADEGVLWFWIVANAFCHQMVRSVVGLLVQVGLGRKRAGDVAGVIRARDRHLAGNPAPPHGLCLWSVHYGD